MRHFRIFFFLLSLFVNIFPLTVYAAETQKKLPPGIFRMSDGAYYQPSTGIRAMTLDEYGLDILPSMSEEVVNDSASSSKAIFPLKSAILRGRELLKSESDAEKTSVPRIAKSEPNNRHITLAIWNPASDEIRKFSGVKEGKKLVPDVGQKDDVQVVVTNGLNSAFRVKGGDIVVAIRYPIYVEIQNSTEKHPLYEVQDAIYTPYSADLRTPEMIAFGKRWLSMQMSTVYTQLRENGVPSRSMPSKLLADVIDPELTQLILAIEHIDPGVSDKNAKVALERFYVTLAANEEDSYDFSKSPVGALGIAQFMPKTYAFVASMSALGLPKDFNTGMRTPLHAITAEVAYLDYLLTQLPKGTVAQLAQSPDFVHEYIAAAYNGGPSRVRKAMNAWEENLDAKERLHVRASSRLRLETMHYVLKLRQVRLMLRQENAQLAQAN